MLTVQIAIDNSSGATQNQRMVNSRVWGTVIGGSKEVTLSKQVILGGTETPF